LLQAYESPESGLWGGAAAAWAESDEQKDLEPPAVADSLPFYNSGARARRPGRPQPAISNSVRRGEAESASAVARTARFGWRPHRIAGREESFKGIRDRVEIILAQVRREVPLHPVAVDRVGAAQHASALTRQPGDCHARVRGIWSPLEQLPLHELIDEPRNPARGHQHARRQVGHPHGPARSSDEPFEHLVGAQGDAAALAEIGIEGARYAPVRPKQCAPG